MIVTSNLGSTIRFPSITRDSCANAFGWIRLSIRVIRAPRVLQAVARQWSQRRVSGFSDPSLRSGVNRLTRLGTIAAVRHRAALP